MLAFKYSLYKGFCNTLFIRIGKVDSGSLYNIYCISIFLVKSKTREKHVQQADSDEKTALVLAAQLSGARKWRNSTNNQVTEALKSVPSPLSDDERQKLRAKDSSDYADANNLYQDASWASNSISAQADYYKSAGVDLSQVSALDRAAKNPGSNGSSYNGYYQRGSSSYVQPSGQTANSSAYNPSNQYSQQTDNSYSNYTYQTTTRSDGYSSGTVENSSEPRGSDSRVSSTVGSNAVGYNTVGYNTTQLNVGGYDNGGSNAVTSSIPGSNTGLANTGGTNTGVSSAKASDQYSSYYGDANNSSAVSAYGSNYGQQATSKDTTDNTVPNGIENQTSYEMNPDASTAQYENNQPATT